MKRRISEYIKYIECNTERKFFKKLNYFLGQGYEMDKHIFLAIDLKKGIDEIILSYQHVKNWRNLMEELNNFNHKYEVVEPDYSNTNLNIVAGARRNFGGKFNYSVDDKLFDKHYDNVVILLLDGLGMNVLEKNLDEKSFLRTHLYKEVSAVFPSTTACATTSLLMGKEPIETCWTGWHNYFKEIREDIILFNGNRYYGKGSVGVTAYDLLGFEPFYHDLNVGNIVHPDFSNPSLDDVLKRSLKQIKTDHLQYVYCTDPDSTMHEYGTYVRKAKKCLRTLDKKVKKYALKLPSNTLLVVVADHGHIPVYRNIKFKENTILMNMLVRLPSNDSRCTTYKVKKEFMNDFKPMFEMFYGEIYDIYTREEALERGFFGHIDLKNPKIDTLLGDFVAIAKSDYVLHTLDDKGLKSHHAGMTKEEMRTPIIVYKK